MRHFFLITGLVGSGLVRSAANAQVYTPVPRSPDKLLATMVLQRQTSLLQTGVSRADSIVSLCAVAKQDSTCLKALASIDLSKLVRTGLVAKSVLPFGLPFRHTRDALVQYLRDAGIGNTTSLATQFNANLSDSTAYVTTDVISGLLGRTLFGIQYARVQRRGGSGDAREEKMLEDNTASALRLLNNGGTITARFLVPMHAGGGLTAQRALSLYTTLGFNGPVSDQSKLGASGSLALESANTFNIWPMDGISDVLGELLVSLRGGCAYADKGVVSDARGKSFCFGQYGVGLRQKAGITVSVGYTLTSRPRVLERHIPRFVFNLSALR